MLAKVLHSPRNLHFCVPPYTFCSLAKLFHVNAQVSKRNSKLLTSKQCMFIQKKALSHSCEVNKVHFQDQPFQLSSKSLFQSWTLFITLELLVGIQVHVRFWFL